MELADKNKKKSNVTFLMMMIKKFSVRMKFDFRKVLISENWL